MKSERLAYAFGKINDDLIYGAVNDTGGLPPLPVCALLWARLLPYGHREAKKPCRNSFWPQ